MRSIAALRAAFGAMEEDAKLSKAWETAAATRDLTLAAIAMQTRESIMQRARRCSVAEIAAAAAATPAKQRQRQRQRQVVLWPRGYGYIMQAQMVRSKERASVPAPAKIPRQTKRPIRLARTEALPPVSPGGQRALAGSRSGAQTALAALESLESRRLVSVPPWEKTAQWHRLTPRPSTAAAGCSASSPGPG